MNILEKSINSTKSLTVSQLRHLVSLVRIPWKMSLIQVCLLLWPSVWSPFELLGRISTPADCLDPLPLGGAFLSAARIGFSKPGKQTNLLFGLGPYLWSSLWCGWWGSWGTRARPAACSCRTRLEKDEMYKAQVSLSSELTPTFLLPLPRNELRDKRHISSIRHNHHFAPS